jgi:ubiquinone/menaquinone biosynthesis C-methylase UbiE
LSDLSYRVMVALFRLGDAVYPTVARRTRGFGIRPGMTVVDYGCGPGRYTFPFARAVGGIGKVYAVDIEPLAVEDVRARAEREGMRNVEVALVTGYQTVLPAHIADMVLAIDMFFLIRDPEPFLRELKRLCKADSTLVIDDGHEPRERTKAMLAQGGQWVIVEESKDHLRCRPT